MTPLWLDPQEQVHGFFISHVTPSQIEARKELVRRYDTAQLWIIAKRKQIVLGTVYNAVHFHFLLAKVEPWSEQGSLASTAAAGPCCSIIISAAAGPSTSAAGPHCSTTTSTAAGLSTAAGPSSTAAAGSTWLTPAKKGHDLPGPAPFLATMAQAGDSVLLEIIDNEHNDRNPPIPNPRLQILPQNLLNGKVLSLVSQALDITQKVFDGRFDFYPAFSWISTPWNICSWARQVSGGRLIRTSSRVCVSHLRTCKPLWIASRQPWASRESMPGPSTSRQRRDQAGQLSLVPPHQMFSTQTSSRLLPTYSISFCTTTCQLCRISSG